MRTVFGARGAGHGARGTARGARRAGHGARGAGRGARPAREHRSVVGNRNLDKSAVALQTTQVMWISRDIEEFLKLEAGRRPAILMTGARQAGKTSLLRRVFPKLRYVSLDLPAVAELAEESGEAFLARYPPPLVVDEIQYAPALLRHVKAAIDSRRDEPGLFLMTGSQKLASMAGVSETLAGRLAVLDCLPLSAAEVERHRGDRLDRPELTAFILSGGYPEIHASGLDPERFYADYVATYLERDVRQALAVRNLRDSSSASGPNVRRRHREVWTRSHVSSAKRTCSCARSSRRRGARASSSRAA